MDISSAMLSILLCGIIIIFWLVILVNKKPPAPAPAPYVPPPPPSPSPYIKKLELLREDIKSLPISTELYWNVNKFNHPNFKYNTITYTLEETVLWGKCWVESCRTKCWG